MLNTHRLFALTLAVSTDGMKNLDIQQILTHR